MFGWETKYENIMCKTFLAHQSCRLVGEPPHRALALFD